MPDSYLSQLKADIAIEHIHKAFSQTELDELGNVMLAVPGVNTWRTLLPVLKEMEVKTVNLAFDMDVLTNSFVKQFYKDMVSELKSLHYHVNIIAWNLKDSKGIDDLFLTGSKPIIQKLF